MADKLPYYETNNLIFRWKLRDGDDGCVLCHNVSMSMDMPPPALPSPPETPKPPAPKPPKVDPYAKTVMDVMDGLSRFKKWLDTPDPPKPPKPPKAPPIKKDYMAVPPFDIQNIPGAMRKEHLTNSAKLMERWFNGELNYGPTSDDVKAEVNQKGEPYPPSMYDMDTIKLDWVLKFPRAREALDLLVNSAIRSENAYDMLQKKLRLYRGYSSVNTWPMCNQSLPVLHKYFEFTFARVGSTFSQKIDEFLRAEINKGVPDDLTGALGSFNIYAAIGYANFVGQGYAEISGIYVYVKDSFDFTDKLGDVSQYLGHWSKNGVILVPYNGLAAALNKPALYTDYPVAVGRAQVAGNVYYPVKNRDFRQWAIKHQRGGDFIVYSDKRWIPVYPPIRVAL